MVIHSRSYKSMTLFILCVCNRRWIHDAKIKISHCLWLKGNLLRDIQCWKWFLLCRNQQPEETLGKGTHGLFVVGNSFLARAFYSCFVMLRLFSYFITIYIRFLSVALHFSLAASHSTFIITPIKWYFILFIKWTELSVSYLWRMQTTIFTVFISYQK